MAIKNYLVPHASISFIFFCSSHKFQFFFTWFPTTFYTFLGIHKFVVTIFLIIGWFGSREAHNLFTIITLFRLVPPEGIEPTLPKETALKAVASPNFATVAL